MKQAKPTAAESLAFLRFMQGMESIIEDGEMPNGRKGVDDVHQWLANEWRSIGPIWQRVYWAGRRASKMPAIQRRRRWSGGTS